MNPDKKDQKTLALWAADCAEHVLGLFEATCKKDDRPWEAIEAGRAWAHGLITCSEARAAASEAHAAARETERPAACAAARAAGHAAATAHAVGHARHAASYAINAVKYAAHRNEVDRLTGEEREWQMKQLPEHLRSAMFH